MKIEKWLIIDLSRLILTKIGVVQFEFIDTSEFERFLNIQ